MAALEKLGGSASTKAIRAQLALPDWHTVNDSEIRKIADKLAKDGKVIVDKSKRIWLFKLKND